MSGVVEGNYAVLVRALMPEGDLDNSQGRSPRERFQPKSTRYPRDYLPRFKFPKGMGS